MFTSCSSLSISESLWKIDYIYTGVSSIDIVKQCATIKKGLILLFLNLKSHKILNALVKLFVICLIIFKHSVCEECSR